MSDLPGIAPGSFREKPLWFSGPGNTLVVGFGNPLRGDDGVGAAILETLQGMRDLPSDVELVECSPSRLLELICATRYRKVIVLDAAEMGVSAGEWARFTPGEVVLPLDSASHRSPHTSGLAEVLALAEALGVLPSEVVIYAVQPEHLDYSSSLSEPVQRAVSEVVRAIVDEVRS